MTQLYKVILFVLAPGDTMRRKIMTQLLLRHSHQILVTNDSMAHALSPAPSLKVRKMRSHGEAPPLSHPSLIEDQEVKDHRESMKVRTHR